jgi:hypothetical protein
MLRFSMILLLAFASACAPSTTFRRAAVVPTPTGETLTNPVHGAVEVAGTFSTSAGGVTQLFPEPGDPGLHVAHTQFGGHVRFRLNEHLSVGGQAMMTHSELSDPSATGVPDLDSFVWGAGPNAAIHFGDPKTVMFGVSLAVTFVEVPWATFTLRDGVDPNAPSASVDDYRLVEQSAEPVLLFRLSSGVEWALHPNIFFFGGLSLQNAATNIGFDNSERSGSTLSADVLGLVPYVGFNFRSDAGVFGSVQYYVPIGYGEIFNSSVMPWGGIELALGAAIDA